MQVSDPPGEISKAVKRYGRRVCPLEVPRKSMKEIVEINAKFLIFFASSGLVLVKPRRRIIFSVGSSPMPCVFSVPRTS